MSVRSVIAISTAVTLSALLASSADAASKVRKHKKPMAYASEQSRVHRGTDKFPAGPLYYNGNEYLGDDPDPFIRSQLWRDLGAHFGGDP